MRNKLSLSPDTCVPSALGGGKFANGAVSGAFMHMFNAEAGLGRTIRNSISYLSNAVQLFAGGVLTYTGIGAIIGVPMMAHAANNMYETYTGGFGPLRTAEESMGLNYDYIDIGVSAVGGFTGAAKQVGVKAVGYWNTNALIGYEPVYNYSTTAGKIDIGVTSAGIANTAYGINRE